ncbi:NAD(P)/FAD-dependent oxidoreductase [Campylobacter sputorum]|uniref:NAD(P)/FAD-dependent oxidoreductase n=1 Tax=Campylobacter sputorum TaxID=206 RepID=UPI000B772E90|nr:NAD(P)/FAD-dependent oxidoreductase [Campylobacter sputorum]ASM36883.1 NADH:quinone oxidoreductase II [Campylobacter sputorum bv. faecalis CCUG 20703]
MYKNKILVLGAGYAGLSFLKNLTAKSINNCEITLINTNSYHYHSALLHKVASGECDSRAIYNLKDVIDEKINLVVDSVVDIKKDKVVTKNGEYKFDYLVIALGYSIEDFGIQGVKKLPSLSSYEEALEIKKDIYQKLDNYKFTNDKKDLSFIICGAGLSGVELAGSLLNELKKYAKKINVDENELNICIVEALPYILPIYDEKLRDMAKSKLESMGVKVYLNSKILSVSNDSIVVENLGEIKANTIIWTAGTRGNDLIKNWDFKQIRSRIEVDGFLNPIGFEKNVYAIGDNSAFILEKPHIQSAQISLKMGKYVAKSIQAKLNGEKDIEKFSFKSLGSVCSIGDNYALGEVLGFKVSGYLGHIMKILIERKWDFILDNLRGFFKNI